MKKLVSLLGFACLSLLPISQIQAAPAFFSNAIFFGDSLTDMGNLPENPTPLTNPSLAPILSNLNANIYVPVSNPLNTDTDANYVNLREIFGITGNPVISHGLALDNSYLPAQQPLAHQARRFHSAIWDEFFTIYANEATPQTGTSYFAMPSTSAEANGYTNNVSVNYAWSSALSDSHSHNPDWNIDYGPYNYTKVMNARTAYENNPYNTKRDLIEVPGMLGQVSQFLTDVATKRVSVDQKSIYTLWIGGNDLSHDFNLIESGKLSAFKDFAYNTPLRNYDAMLNLIHGQGVQAKNIFLFKMFNVSLTPKVQNWQPSWMIPLMKVVGKSFATIYNFGLEIAAAEVQHKYPDVHVFLVPTDKWFKEMSKGQDKVQCQIKILGKTKSFDSNKTVCSWLHGKVSHVYYDFSSLGFKNTMGDACQLNQYPARISANAPKDNCKNYMFWNEVHPSTQTGQVLGYLFSQFVQEKLSQETKTTNNAIYAPLTPAAQKQADRDFTNDWHTNKVLQGLIAVLKSKLHIN